MPSGATTRAHVRSPGSEPPPPPERRRTTTTTTTTEEAAAAVEGVDGGACDWRALLRKAAGRALGGGVPGAMAMLVQASCVALRCVALLLGCAARRLRTRTCLREGYSLLMALLMLRRSLS